MVVVPIKRSSGPNSQRLGDFSVWLACWACLVHCCYAGLLHLPALVASLRLLRGSFLAAHACLALSVPLPRVSSSPSSLHPPSLHLRSSIFALFFHSLSNLFSTSRPSPSPSTFDDPLQFHYHRLSTLDSTTSSRSHPSGPTHLPKVSTTTERQTCTPPLSAPAPHSPNPERIPSQQFPHACIPSHPLYQYP